MIDPNPIPSTSTNFMLPGHYPLNTIYALGHPDVIDKEGNMIMELVKHVAGNWRRIKIGDEAVTPNSIIRGIKGTVAINWPSGVWVEMYETPQA